MTHSKENLRIKGHKGTWYVIGEVTTLGKQYWLLESEIWGDEAPCLIVRSSNLMVVVDNVYNGFEDLYDTLSI